MKGFIEVTVNKEPTTQLVNLRNVESFTRLTNGTLVHYVSKSTLTVRESYEQIKELIKQAQE